MNKKHSKFTALKLLACFAIAVCSATASIAAGPSGASEVGSKARFNAPFESPLDSRIRYYAYTPDIVYDLTVKAGDQHTHIKFDPEETLTEKPKMGDTVQWRVTGNGKNLYVKALVSGLATSFSVVTSKRVYQFQLRSTDSVKDTVQMVYFMYPDDEERLVIQKAQAESSAKFAELSRQEKDSRTLLPALSMDVTNLTIYELTGSLPFKTRAMFADRTHTYLEIPANTQDLPAVFITNADNKAVPVNYAVKDGWIIIERVEPQFEMRLGSMKIIAKAIKKDIR